MIKKDIDYSKLSDKGLLTPPYASWEHALRASIRLWQLILGIPWWSIKHFTCVTNYKEYVFEKLDISLRPTLLCPMCHYADKNNITCIDCPLPESCESDSSHFGVIRIAAEKKDYSGLLINIERFIHAMENQLNKIQAKKLIKESESTKTNNRDNKHREGSLKALEQSLRLWWTIYNLTECEVNQALVNSNTSLSNSLTVNLKLIAWKKLGVDSKDRPQYLCPLCEFHRKSSKCPLSVHKNPNLNGPWTCGTGCMFTPYGEIHKSRLIGSTGFLHHNKLKLIVADFLSVLWTKYLEMDPFNSKLNNAAEKEKD